MSVSKAVVPPQVWMVAVPDSFGVHANTRSGAASPPQLPASVLAPEVVPLNVPPSGGMTTAFRHASGVVVVARAVKQVHAARLPGLPHVSLQGSPGVVASQV